MPCYSLMLAVTQPGKTKNGKTPLKFIGKATSYALGLKTLPKRMDKAMLIPCRQCIGCRLEKSRQWATRLLHETQFHKDAVFLTLTYDDEHIPLDRSLNPSHLTTFFKDLRARNSYYGKAKIKYFACGEYGDQTHRPHYHAALYGDLSIHDPEAHPEEPARSGDVQFSHPDIRASWPYGLHRFSQHTFETAAYVARYVLKKITGAKSQNHYQHRTPEFQRSSNGLGKGHVNTWLSDIYPSDHVVLPERGSFLPPPYYDRLLEKIDPQLFQKVKTARKEAQETLTGISLKELLNERDREGQVRTIVTDQTLIRGIL